MSEKRFHSQKKVIFLDSDFGIDHSFATFCEDDMFTVHDRYGYFTLIRAREWLDEVMQDLPEENTNEEIFHRARAFMTRRRELYICNN